MFETADNVLLLSELRPDYPSFGWILEVHNQSEQFESLNPSNTSYLRTMRRFELLDVRQIDVIGSEHPMSAKDRQEVERVPTDRKEISHVV